MLTESEWEQAQQRMTAAWHRGDLASAMAEIQVVLSQGNQEMKGQALIYRGMIHDDEGNLADAMSDWKNALSYCNPGSYAKYVAERTLAEGSEKLGLVQEALTWYRAALSTCANGDEFSCGIALKGFLRVSGEQMSPNDKSLITSVANKSWHVLGLPGTPDLNNLTATADMLASKAGQP